MSELVGKKFPVLDDGFVVLTDYMGSDQSIENAARVSYGEGTRKISDTNKLLRYLLRKSHTSPFEQAELQFHIRMPMDSWRQQIRHRTANVNEYSTRYSEAIDSAFKAEEWRLQSDVNNQGSKSGKVKFPEDYRVRHFPDGFYVTSDGGASFTCHSDQPEDYLSERENALQAFAREVYEERLKFGVSREQARKDLPLSTYTEAYWKIDLHNLLHYLALRMDSHAQWEIRQYAEVIGHQIVANLFPITWQAFLDYRVNSTSLTALDIEVIKAVTEEAKFGTLSIPITYEEFMTNQHPDWVLMDRCRERDECWDKLVSLGIGEI